MKEKQFWNRILEFAQERLTRSMYDFYATPAELIKVEENTATIFLPRSEMEMVWEKLTIFSLNLRAQNLLK